MEIFANNENIMRDLQGICKIPVIFDLKIIFN